MNAAERALLDDLQTISTWESNHVADFADYDACKLRDHERLFLIYRATHATNKMEYEFQQSLKCLNDSRTRWKSPPANLTPADIVSGLEKIESNVNVQWKTNFNF